MADKYLISNGGNWTDDTSWSTSAAGAALNTNDTTKPTASDDVFLIAASGQCTISAASVGKSLTCTGYTNTLTHNAFLLTISGNVTLVSTMTYTPASSSSTIRMDGTSIFTSGTKLLYSVYIGSSGTLGDNLSFVAQKDARLLIQGSLNLNSNVVAGNSETNRVQVLSFVLGIAVTITVTADNQFANCNFRDITFSSASNRDFSAISGGSGDCGGNSITGGGTTLTFTTSAPQTCTGNSANWSAATWSGRVPLPQDDTIISLTAGQTLTVDMPRLGRDISFGTATNLTLGNAVTSYGSLDLTGMGTLAGAFTWNLESRGTAYLTSAGKTFIGALVSATFGGSLQIQDSLSVTLSLVITDGTFLSNGNSISVQYVYDNASTRTKIVNMGSSSWNLSNNSGDVWNMVQTSCTIIPGSSTIYITNNGNSSKSFRNSNTYNNLSITAGGTGAIIISGSNTFNTLQINSPKTVTFTAGTTQQVANFVATGTAGNLITLNATAGVVPILNYTGSRNVQTDYLSIQGINVTPSNKWYYGNNSQDGVGLEFQGQASGGDYVSVENSATKNQAKDSTTFSTESWFVARSIGSVAGRIIDKTDGTTLSVGYRVICTGTNAIDIAMGSGGLQLGTTSNSGVYSFNALTHVITTWSSGSAPKIYVNGSEVTYSVTNSVTTPGNDSAIALNFGNWSGRTRTFYGVIFATRIYQNKALSAPEVAAAYAAGPKASLPVTGCTQQFLFNEGTGTTLTDSVGGVNGTITGALWANTGWNSDTPIRSGFGLSSFGSLPFGSKPFIEV